MASTNKTPNLGLCQWEATDPFLREDMNEVLQKIDQAIGNMPRKKLFDVTISHTPISFMEFDFTEIDVEQFGELNIFFSFAEDRKYMRMNNVTGSNAYSYSSSGGGSSTDRISISTGTSRLSITPQKFIHQIDGSSQTELMHRSMFPSLDSLQIICYDTEKGFAAGDRISIWGVRR